MGSRRAETTTISLQEQWFPGGMCFGCGPANASGLGLRSFPADHEVVATWQSEPYHQAGPQVLAGGVIGTLLDCHSGAAVIQAVASREGKIPYVDGDPWVTRSFEISMHRSTPLGEPLRLRAWVDEIDDHRALARGEVAGPDGPTATIVAEWRRLIPRT